MHANLIIIVGSLWFCHIVVSLAFGVDMVVLNLLFLIMNLKRNFRDNADET